MLGWYTTPWIKLPFKMITLYEKMNQCHQNHSNFEGRVHINVWICERPIAGLWWPYLVFTAKLWEVYSVHLHDDVIKWKHFPHYWPFVRGIHRGPVNSLHKDQWRGALMFSLICARIKGWVNNCEAGDLRRHLAHYGVTVMGKKAVLSRWNSLFDPHFVAAQSSHSTRGQCC